MSKLKILFVDDESNILQALRRSLSDMREHWQMSFAESGEKALTLLQRDPYDILVTDMRMTGMNGLDLLDMACRHYPEMLRILLSGHSDMELVMQSTPKVHQYLTKPCKPETLKTVIEKSMRLRALVQDPDLKATIAKIGIIPTLPGVYQDLCAELKSSNTSFKRIGAIVEGDPAISAKLLQLVNSSFFGLARSISNPEKAATYLGTEVLKGLVLTIGLFEVIKPKTIEGFSIDNLWEHCLQTGMQARRIAEKMGLSNAQIDDAYMAGLLHDIGKLILAARIPDQLAASHRHAEEQSQIFYKAEKALFSITHAEIGGYLIGLWGLPTQIVEAVVCHHQPFMLGPRTDCDTVTITHIANAMANVDATGEFADMKTTLDQNYVDQVFKTGELQRLMDAACEGHLMGET